MSWPGPDRWLRLWKDTGAHGDPEQWYERLTRAYAEPQRHYHTQQHIGECLAEFDGARDLARQPGTLELALWFHDVVYDPKASDNEERSAAVAKDCLETAGLRQLATAVGELIMVTKSHCSGTDPDAALMVDVDLSILGQARRRFAEYEAQVREEYHWVPTHDFNLKRAEILERFLGREHIYTTDHFRTRYERQARDNLEHSVRMLRRVGE